MIPRDNRQAPHRDLLATYLEEVLNTRHELVQMGKRIDWATCEQHFGRLYAVESGRPWAAHPIARRLAAGHRQSLTRYNNRKLTLVAP